MPGGRRGFTNLCAELTAGQGVDAAITACPVGQAQADAVAIAAQRGRISLFGGLPKQSS